MVALVKTTHVSGGRRFFHLDWLRAAAVLLGIPFHVGLIHSSGTPWFVSSPQTDPIISTLTGLLTSFRMPLFFMMAGLLSALVLAKRERSIWLGRRCVRLGVPYITASLLLSPLVFLVIAAQNATGGSFSAMKVSFFDLIASPGNHWVGHLWFLIVLLELSFLTFLLAPFLSRIGAVIKSRCCDSHGVLRANALLGCSVVVAAFIVLEEGAFYVLEGRSALLDTIFAISRLEDLLSMLPYYFIGLLLYDQRLPMMHRNTAVLALFGVAAALYSQFWNEAGIIHKLIAYVGGATVATLFSFVLISWTEVILTRDSRRMQAVVDASFTIYLVHYPVLVIVGYAMIIHGWPVWPSYLLNIAFTVIVSLILHNVIARSAFVRFLFNGETKTKLPRIISAGATPTSILQRRTANDR